MCITDLSQIDDKTILSIDYIFIHPVMKDSIYDFVGKLLNYKLELLGVCQILARNTTHPDTFPPPNNSSIHALCADISVYRQIIVLKVYEGMS